jgi:DNA-binding CsgD family transcriptional regulator
MDNSLTDFLTRLVNIRMAGARAGNPSAPAVSAFYAFLEEVGVEHCNFAGWKIEPDGAPEFNRFNGTRLPAPFLEEYSAELVADDYVMRRGKELSATKPVMRFDIGLNFASEMESFHPPTTRVLDECARYGIKDGFAIIGDTSRIRTGDGRMGGRYFGFCFAGNPGTNGVIRNMQSEIEIATFALLDQIMPDIEAAIDRFDSPLTPRERDVLAALAAGAMRKQIAHDLNIALPTVDMHIGGLKKKLKAATLPEAVARALRYDLL